MTCKKGCEKELKYVWLARDCSVLAGLKTCHQILAQSDLDVKRDIALSLAAPLCHVSPGMFLLPTQPVTEGCLDGKLPPCSCIPVHGLLGPQQCIPLAPSDRCQPVSSYEDALKLGSAKRNIDVRQVDVDVKLRQRPPILLFDLWREKRARKNSAM